MLNCGNYCQLEILKCQIYYINNGYCIYQNSILIKNFKKGKPANDIKVHVESFHTYNPCKAFRNNFFKRFSYWDFEFRHISYNNNYNDLPGEKVKPERFYLPYNNNYNDLLGEKVKPERFYLP